MKMTSEKDKEAKVLWCKNSDVIERMIEGEAVLLDFKTGVYYSLNETGTVIWGLIGSPVTTGQLVETIAEKYEAEMEEIEKSVYELLLELEGQNLVTRAEVNGD